MMYGAPAHSVWMVCQAKASHRRARFHRLVSGGGLLLVCCVLMGVVL